MSQVRSHEDEHRIRALESALRAIVGVLQERDIDDGLLNGIAELAVKALADKPESTKSGPRQAAVSLIEREDGRILCVWNRRYVGWTLPGGMVEAGETPAEAQRRELREETGLETEAADLLLERERERDAGHPDRASRVFVYRVRAIGTPRPVEGNPTTWLTRAEFVAESPFGAFYEKAFAEIPGPVVEDTLVRMRTQLGSERDRVEQRDAAIASFVAVQQRWLGFVGPDVSVPSDWKGAYDNLRALSRYRSPRDLTVALDSTPDFEAIAHATLDDAKDLPLPSGIDVAWLSRQLALAYDAGRRRNALVEDVLDVAITKEAELIETDAKLRAELHRLKRHQFERDHQIQILIDGCMKRQAMMEDYQVKVSAICTHVAALEEALVWCSGSADFAPGGFAYDGWQKLCAPLLRTISQSPNAGSNP